MLDHLGFIVSDLAAARRRPRRYLLDPDGDNIEAGACKG